MFIRITYKDGRTLIQAAAGNAMELDLDTKSGADIFSIEAIAGDKVIFTAYHWHNNPNEE